MMLPQLAGTRIDPPVSEPVPPRHNPAAMAAPVPLEEPPGERVRSQGLCASPKKALVPEMPAANSFMFVLPSETTPACAMRATTVASALGMRSLKNSEPTVVRTPRVS